jgi:hypothetical protein
MKMAMGGGALIRIAVTDAAWVAIVATLPATVDTGTIQRSFSGRKLLIWLPNEVVEKLTAERRWWESDSDVILRLANDRDNVARPRRGSIPIRRFARHRATAATLHPSAIPLTRSSAIR